MEDDHIAILTLPYNNDLEALYNNTNNIFTIILICVQILLLITIVLVSYLIPLLNDTKIGSSYLKVNSSPLLSSYAIVIYSHILIWLLMIVIRYYLRNIYYKRLRVMGYHKHHSTVSWLSLCPVFVLHKANALLLLSTTIICKYADSDIHISSNISLKSVNIPQIIISLSATIITPFLIKLLYHEIRFRQMKNPPDVFCVDDPQHLEHAGLSHLALRSSQFLEDLLEKQSDLIYNLKLQNSHLRMMLFKVSQKHRTNNNGEVPASNATS